jgi:hypothetical protein
MTVPLLLGGSASRAWRASASARSPADGVPLGDGGAGATPAGLHSESGAQSDWNFEEAGFRLVLPFALRRPGEDGSALALLSGMGPVSERSVAELFQHGFRPFGSFADPAQRLERLPSRRAFGASEGLALMAPSIR